MVRSVGTYHGLQTRIDLYGEGGSRVQEGGPRTRAAARRFMNLRERQDVVSIRRWDMRVALLAPGDVIVKGMAIRALII